MTRWMEIVARLGDTVLDVAHVPAGTTYRLGPVAIAATPQHARLGLVEVTVTPSSRPVRDLPRPSGDPRGLAYVLGSLVAHVAMWGLAIELHPRAGGLPAALGDRNTGGPVAFVMAGGGVGAPETDDDAASDRPAISMALATPRRAPAIATAGTPDLASALRTLVATTDVASGFSPGAGAGAGDGAGTGDGFGSGIGGGPPVHGLVGTVPYATGHGGHGRGGGWGLIARDSRVPTVGFCGGPAPCVVTGDLDKAIVRRYIQRQRARIEYCYTKQLLATPDLGGTVTTEFVIGADGNVQAARAGGMHETVASCVGNVLRTIEFPRSATGTATQVRYPFTFRSVD